MRYPLEILAMLTHDGFDERYHDHCKTSKTYVEAYEKTELEFEDYFAKRKYSSYDSFRITHNNRMKNNQKNRKHFNS